MTKDELKSSADWLNDPEFEGVTVLDPDGWDRTNFAASWAEPISRNEFRRRLFRSTAMRLAAAR